MTGRHQLSFFPVNRSSSQNKYRSFLEYRTLKEEYIRKVIFKLQKYEKTVRKELSHYNLSPGDIEEILQKALLRTLKQVEEKSKELIYTSITPSKISITLKYYKMNILHELSKLKKAREHLTDYHIEENNQNNIYSVALALLADINQELHQKLMKFLQSGKFEELELTEQEKSDVALALHMAEQRFRLDHDHDSLQTLSIYHAYNRKER